jgi:DNA-directed RNA polymerase subunit alpha
MSIIKPNKLVTYFEKDNPRVLKVIAEPLERGFGITLGNALRRVLLSSLQGAAVTFIKIAGITHEFQPWHGVKEDVTDVILNLKAMVIKMLSPERQTIKLKVEGPCVVTAGMIEKNSEVQIIDPHHVICTLESNISLDMEMICEIGRGYLPAHMVADKNSQMPMGKSMLASLEYIPIDALFSPIRSVFYKVEHTRVGQITDYDRLIMTIESNGAISPADALSLSTKILQDQFNLFLIGDVQEYKVDSGKVKQHEIKFHPILLRQISTFDLSIRSQNCFKGDNIVYIGDLVQKTEVQLLQLKNFGRKSLDEVYQLLEELNREFFADKDSKIKNQKVASNSMDQQFSFLSLGMKIPDWNKDAVEDLVKKYDNVTC